jgi:hypothetical protein
VSFDWTTNELKEIDAPENWMWLQRNGRMLIRSPTGLTHQLEAAQVFMLEHMAVTESKEQFLEAIMQACDAQTRQGGERQAHWSRSLLACLAKITGARGLIGCRSVTYHPHYWWYVSPDQPDQALGAKTDWPP